MSASSRVVSSGSAPGPDSLTAIDAAETQVGAWQWDFGTGVFSVDVPKDAAPLTIEELRKVGPLGERR